MNTIDKNVNKMIDKLTDTFDEPIKEMMNQQKSQNNKKIIIKSLIIIGITIITIVGIAVYITTLIH